MCQFCVQFKGGLSFALQIGCVELMLLLKPGCRTYRIMCLCLPIRRSWSASICLQTLIVAVSGLIVCNCKQNEWQGWSFPLLRIPGNWGCPRSACTPEQPRCHSEWTISQTNSWPSPEAWGVYCYNLMTLGCCKQVVWNFLQLDLPPRFWIHQELMRSGHLVILEQARLQDFASGCGEPAWCKFWCCCSEDDMLALLQKLIKNLQLLLRYRYITLVFFLSPKILSLKDHSELSRGWRFYSRRIDEKGKLAFLWIPRLR